MLAIDIETYSSIDITKCGVYAYTEAEDFEVLLFAYAYDEEEVKLIDLALGDSKKKLFSVSSMGSGQPPKKR